MLSQENILKLIEDSIASLRRIDLIKEDLTVSSDTVLLGSGSVLDSIAFVTFITDVEDRLNRETGQELFLVLTDIHEFNTESSYLTVSVLVHHIVKLTQS